MKSTTLATSCILGATLIAQSTSILPRGFEKTTALWPGNLLTLGTRDLPVHAQYGYDARDIPTKVKTIRSIAFRRFNQPWYITSPRKETMSMSLSVGPLTPRSFTAQFAKNAGRHKQTVFSGTISWPKTTPTKKVPTFAVRIPFSSPYVWRPSSGKSLVVDCRVTNSSAYAGDWLYDRAIWNWGFFYNFNHGQFLCKDSMGRRISQLWVPSELFPLQPGGAFSVTYLAGTPNSTGLASIGLAGVGGRWGATKLPIDLRGLGAPGCYWAVASLFFWPFSTDRFGNGAVPPLPIPNDRSLVKVHFFDQSFLLDPAANALGFVPILSSEFEIGSGLKPNVCTVFLINDKNNGSTGMRYAQAQAPIIEIGY